MTSHSGGADGVMIPAEAVEVGFLKPSTPSRSVCWILFTGLRSEVLLDEVVDLAGGRMPGRLSWDGDPATRRSEEKYRSFSPLCRDLCENMGLKRPGIRCAHAVTELF